MRRKTIIALLAVGALATALASTSASAGWHGGWGWRGGWHGPWGAGFGVGGQYGRGALRVSGRTIGYFSTTSGSFGMQVGAQSRAIFYAFMTQGALDRFKRSSGWSAGADATVALVKMGANGKIDTSTAVNPIEAFVMTNAGLMAGVSLEGTKVSRLDI